MIKAEKGRWLTKPKDIEEEDGVDYNELHVRSTTLASFEDLGSLESLTFTQVHKD